ncbi:MAG: sugar transferase [Clostridiales bacterium]|nr:sugar transferase [Clostridiales bacterium]
MQDITELALSAKLEIAGYIKEDTLETVNAQVQEANVKDTFYTRYGKRFLDIIIGLLGFLISLPINLIIAVVTFFDVGRPIIFKQQRVGKDEKLFTIYKFRNMTNDVDSNGELLPPSERVTKWGKFVRRTSLDELLNFVSIIKGDMSVIGPRPIMDYYAARLNKRHKAIYAVRPGLECPTPYKVDHVLSWQERLDNYVWYTEHCSFLLDVKLMFRVVSMAFDRKSTAQRSNAGHGGLMGYDLEGNVIYTKAVPDQYVEAYLERHGYESLEDAIFARTGRLDTRVEEKAHV